MPDENKVVNNPVLNIEQMTRDVEAVTKFDITKQELEEMVKVSQNITENEDPAIIKEKRLELRRVEIRIEERGKSFRDVFTAVNRQISSKEDELLAITGPEIKRLQAIEAENKAKELHKLQVAKLPERLSRLEVVGEGTQEEEDKVLEMTDNEFEAYYNKRVAHYNETVAKQQAEEQKKKQEEAEAKLAEERKKIDEEKAKAQAEIDAKRKVEEDKLTEERKKIDEEKAKAQAEIDAKRKVEEDKLTEERKKIEAEAELKRKDDEAKQQAREEELRLQREADAKVKAEEEAKLAAERKKLDEEKAEMKRKEDERLEAQRKAEADRVAKEKEAKMKPDKEKLKACAAKLEVAIEEPDEMGFGTQDAYQILSEANKYIIQAINLLNR